MLNAQGPIFVIGGCGYIGSHVTRQLSESGHQVVVIDNLSTGFRENLLHEEKLVVADLGDRSALDTLFAVYRPATVIHFAASIDVAESVEQPLAYYRNNTINTIHLLEVCQRWGVSNFLFSSTAAVYGEGHQRPVRETDSTCPANPYGRSKLMDEQIIRDFAQVHAMNYTILRYFNVAGAEAQGRLGQRSENGKHLIKVACDVALGKRPVMTVYGDDYDTPDGTCVRDFIHVEDLAAAHVLAVEKMHSTPTQETFNCGYGQGYSVKQVIETLQSVTGRTIPVHCGPRRPGDIASLTADSHKIKQVLGWQPRFAALEVILASAWQWESRQHSPQTSVSMTHH